MSDLYTRLVAGCLFPIHEYLKKHSTVEVRNAMEESQWWSAKQLRVYQLERLQGLLEYVYERVPYYNSLFNKLKFEPGITDLSDLENLPFLTKNEIREHSDELKASGATGLSRFNTGGSSGEPLIFFIGNERVSHDVAAKWRATRWWNMDIGDPEIVVWGSPIELGGQDGIKAIRDKLLRTTLLPAFEMSGQKLDKFLERIRQFKPRMLFGYPSSLSLIAQHARKRNVSMSDLGIKVAFVTSERLYDHQREIISEVFGCPVANGYGGRDAGFIAHACPEGSMHITSEDIIVEIIDSDGRVLPAGQLGEIVITHMATRDFPFIRYRTGDMGVLSSEPCSCGRGLPVLKEIQGRTTDFIVAQDGTVMHGLALIYILRDLPGIDSFKIIQHSLDNTEVQIVSGNGYSDDCLVNIERGFKQRLGGGVSIDIKKVPSIPAEKSGKFRYVVSHVSTPVS